MLCATLKHSAESLQGFQFIHGSICVYLLSSVYVCRHVMACVHISMLNPCIAAGSHSPFFYYNHPHHNRGITFGPDLSSVQRSTTHKLSLTYTHMHTHISPCSMLQRAWGQLRALNISSKPPLPRMNSSSWFVWKQCSRGESRVCEGEREG